MRLHSIPNGSQFLRMLITTVVSFGLWFFDFYTDVNVIQEIMFVYTDQQLDEESRFIFSGLLCAFLVAPLTAEVTFIRFIIQVLDILAPQIKSSFQTFMRGDATFFDNN